MIETPHLVVTEPQHYAFLHLLVPTSEVKKAMGPAIEEVMAAVAQQGAKPTGTWFMHYLIRPMLHFDVEVCVPVAEPLKPLGRVETGFWPATKAAQTIYHGKYSGLPAAWDKFEAWVKTQPGQPGTELWERYLVGPDSNPHPADWRTELDWPMTD
jgi:effector-binding domain-containing protein